MANAIKHISVERGYDVTEYTLCCFGGAGGQHACLVADALGMTRVLLHPFAGVLSAYGMGLADVRALKQRAVEARLTDAALAAVAADFAALEAAARAEVAAQGIAAARIDARRTLHLKYEGTDTTIETPVGAATQVIADFERRYRAQYGFLMPGKPLVIEAIAVEAIGRAQAVEDTQPEFAPRPGPLAPLAATRIYTEGAFHDTQVFDRDAMRPGDAVTGPAVIREENATTVVEPGWRALFTARGDLVLERHEAARRTHAIGTTADPVLLEVFNNLFMAIAEQMGVTLANTAYSVNIKERLDFSCAIFDAQGNLIANAPHMPVHLGSMGESVKTIVDRRRGAMVAGDVFVLNAPYNGGTHLPDVTVIAPVFLAGGAAPEFYVASRGHHADIGGTTPGSMPPDSTHVDEEGVLLDNVQLVAAGRFLEDEMRALLAGGRYPSRNVDQNLADLRAQVAACAKGSAGAAAHGRALLAAGGARVHAARPGQRRGVGAPRARRAEGRPFRGRDGQRGEDRGDDHHRPSRAPGDDRLHRHQRAAADQLQRAVGGVQGGGALRVPDAGRRRDPDERRVPEAAVDRDPGRLDAGARAIRRRWWPATSRPRRRSPTRSTARWACWRRRRER